MQLCTKVYYILTQYLISPGPQFLYVTHEWGK